jgi:hypothetical protein
VFHARTNHNFSHSTRIFAGIMVKKFNAKIGRAKTRVKLRPIQLRNEA